jgi:hypothetical protein
MQGNRSSKPFRVTSLKELMKTVKTPEVRPGEVFVPIDKLHAIIRFEGQRAFFKPGALIHLVKEGEHFATMQKKKEVPIEQTQEFKDKVGFLLILLGETFHLN